MKRLLLLGFVSIFYNFISYTQYWGANLRSQFTNEAVDVELNNQNESYVLGYISGETAFNSANLVSSTAGNSDVYVAKYNASGGLIWKKIFGGNFADRGADLAIGPDDNIVITGQFFGSIAFGSITLQSVSNSKDIFLAKLDPLGNVVWARSEGGNMSENAYGVTVDYNNNVILTGQYQGTATIGTNTFTSLIDPMNSQYSYDLFIAKYDSSGNPLWSIDGKGEYEDRGLAVAVDDQNNIFCTGQFSKTFQFANNTYNNLGYNIGYLAKISPSGSLQFFNQMKAGMTLPYDLEVDKTNKVVISGDFLGVFNYYDNSGPHSFQNTYAKKMFILKTENNGQYIWNYTLGSNNDVSSRSISIDQSNNIYITGFFKCDLSQIQDTSHLIFNAVGFKDGYLLKVNSSGTHNYIRQFGGKMDDEGMGVAIRINEKPHICGSYTKDLNIPESFFPSQYNNNNSFELHAYPTSYESAHYYLVGDSSRNSFLFNNINQSTNNLNYFIPSVTDSVFGQIYPYQYEGQYVNDTLHFCSNASLVYTYPTYSHYGPSYNSVWNGVYANPTLYIDSTSDYYVTVKRDDQCALDVDSIHAILEPTPTLPTLTDNVGINVANPGPNYNNYHYCYPDSVEIHYTNVQPGDSIFTYLNGHLLFTGLGPQEISSSLGYSVVSKNLYCTNNSGFLFELDYPAPNLPVAPKIIMANPSNAGGDSITICYGDPVYFSGIDTLINVAQNFSPQIQVPSFNHVWLTNGTIFSLDTDFVEKLYPYSSGWYSIDLYFTTGYDNLCGVDTTVHHTSRMFYITVLPLPSWNTSIIGSNLLCPNGSVYLVATNPNPNLQWTGPGIIWSNNNDSILVNSSGTYHYGGNITDTLGCSKYVDFTHTIQTKISPTIYSNPADGILCPYDSVQLILPNTYVSYAWVGPSNDTLSTSNTCYGDELGFYVCYVEDYEGCILTTPPYEIREYTTPSLTVMPDEYLCTNETVTLSVTYSGNSQFIWHPTNSTQDHITTNTPGIYSVTISQCGITISDSIEIIDGTFTASIQALDTTICYQEYVTINGTPAGYMYEWNDGQTSNGSYQVNTPGTYFATVTNEYGCQTQTNSVTIYPVSESTPPVIPSQHVCLGSNVNITDNTTYNLNWYSVDDTTLLYNGSTLWIPNISHDTSFLVAYSTPFCTPVYSTINITLEDSLQPFEILGDSLLCQQENASLHVNTTTENVVWFHNGNQISTTNSVNIPFADLVISPTISVQISNQCYVQNLQEVVTILPTPSIQLTEDTIYLCYYESDLATVINPTSYNNIYWTSPSIGGTITSEDLLVQGSSNYTSIIVSGIDTNSCSTDQDTLTVITPHITFSLETEFPNYCIGDSGLIIFHSYNLDSMIWHTPFGTYSNDSINITIDTSLSGNYYVEFWDTLNCHYSDSIFIPAYALPNLSILPDSVFCLNDIYTYFFPNDTNYYQWVTYGNDSTIPIQFDQNLILQAISPSGCLVSDTLVVHTVDCDDELPNIISPNGDGINDFFFIDDATSQHKNEIFIKNRYGNIVFEASPYLNDFDGKDLTEGVYFYVYTPNEAGKTQKRGFLTIIR